MFSNAKYPLLCLACIGMAVWVKFLFRTHTLAFLQFLTKKLFFPFKWIHYLSILFCIFQHQLNRHFFLDLWGYHPKKKSFFNCQFFSFENLWHPVFLSDHIKIKKVSWRNPSSNVQRRIFFRYNIHLTRKIPWGLE